MRWSGARDLADLHSFREERTDRLLLLCMRYGSSVVCMLAYGRQRHWQLRSHPHSERPPDGGDVLAAAVPQADGPLVAAAIPAISRIALSTFFVAIPGAIVARGIFRTGDAPGLDLVLLAIQATATFLVVVALAGGVLWARQRGLGRIDTLRLLTGSTSPSSGWNSAGLSQLLAPSVGRVRTPETHDPDDHARAIRQLVEILPPRHAGLRLVAINLVDDALAALSARGDEESELGANAPIAESDRLQARLVALGPATEYESSERAEMRELLRHELDLHARMRDRFVVAADQRARRFDRLKNLYSVLCVACNENDAEGGTEIAGSVLAACAELRAELEVANT